MLDVHIGPFPPPLGGISVYLYRLSKSEIDSCFIDTKNIMGGKKFRIWLIKQVFSLKKKNFIYHSHLLKNRIIFYLLSCISIHKFSLVIHGRALIDQYQKSKLFGKLLIRKMLKNANFIQVVNPDFKFFIYSSLKIKNKNIFIKNAFLPPPLDDEDSIIVKYNEVLLNFLKIKKPIILANAFALSFYQDIDLYGLDMCIELMGRLKKDYPNIGFLFALANEKKNITYLKKMKNKIKTLNIENNFHFMTGQRELWPIFKKIDLLVRPTNRDGDAISIREALHFNVPVITSDVTSRPKECILFKNRDTDDLYLKTKKLLSKIGF